METKVISILKINKINKFLNKRPILQNINLELNFGEAVGLLGPNGAGKTTCFSIITGLLTPDSGNIIFEDYNVTNLPMYRRARLGIGYLPQDTSIFRGLTVADNILCVLELFEKDPDKREDKLENLLNEFSLSHLRQSPAIALSGGERRRVEIARSLAAKPKILLLDEPLAGIDPIAIAEIRDLILRLKKMGIGIFITDHNVRETLDIVDRAYIIAHGKVLCEGTPQEIIHHPDVRRVYLGEKFSI